MQDILDRLEVTKEQFEANYEESESFVHEIWA